MTRTRTEALAYLREHSEHGDPFDVGLCLQRVRMAYGIDARWPDAAAAWREAEHKHRTTDLLAIPAGVPVFWLGGRENHGHIAVKAGGHTVDVWSTDKLRRGRWDRVDGRTIARDWGLQLVGWAEDVNGVRVYTPPAPKPRRVDNHVTAARGLLQRAARELDATPADRAVCHQQADVVRQVLANLPPT